MHHDTTPTRLPSNPRRAASRTAPRLARPTRWILGILLLVPMASAQSLGIGASLDGVAQSDLQADLPSLQGTASAAVPQLGADAYISPDGAQACASSDVLSTCVEAETPKPMGRVEAGLHETKDFVKNVYVSIKARF